MELYLRPPPIYLLGVEGENPPRLAGHVTGVFIMCLLGGGFLGNLTGSAEHSVSGVVFSRYPKNIPSSLEYLLGIIISGRH